MGVTQIKEWFNRFKDGRTSAERKQRCGRPQTARSAANVKRVRNLVMADRRLTVREIAEEVGVSKDSAHAILREDLNMNRVAAKFVSKLLSPEQKDLRFDVAHDLLDTANTDPGFLNTVINGDESWVFQSSRKEEISQNTGREEEETDPRRRAGYGTEDSKTARHSKGKEASERRQVRRGRFSRELLRERERRCSKTGPGRPSTSVKA
ncbi:HTH_48 domain-containing protein [Nephila pilipes]|uniref:HTH_48 domain-containing protein n=1 Tax=Nephila pilipes TaxID=299642 RepID=A0A8X6QW92_NEPPI|nr:HTH_48 domain-containing protein [Nephila pilipes]